jgi:hypothetical protein
MTIEVTILAKSNELLKKFGKKPFSKGFKELCEKETDNNFKMKGFLLVI